MAIIGQGESTILRTAWKTRRTPASNGEGLGPPPFKVAKTPVQLADHFLLASDVGVSMKPREKLCTYGAAQLSNAELLALLLGTGTRDQPVSTLAALILDRCGGIHELACLNARELAKVKGVGTSKA